MTGTPAPRTAVVRGTAGGLLAVTVGAGLLVQLARSHAWSDPAGTVLYVVAAALLIMVLRPGWPPWLLATLAGALSIMVEMTQVRGGPAEWVPRSGPLRLLLGGTFTVADVCWLATGAAVAWLAVRLVALGGVAGTRRPGWQSGLALAAAGAGAMLFGSVLGWTIDIGGRRLPGAVEWAPIVLGGAVLLAGVADTWRGLSRDDHTPDPQAVGRRTAMVLLLAVPAVVMVALVVGAAGGRGPLVVALVTAGGFGLAIVMSMIVGWGDGVPQRGRALVGTLTSLAVVTLGIGVAGPVAAEPTGTAQVPVPTFSRPARPVPPTPVAPPPPSRIAPAPDAPDDVELCRVEQLRARTQGWDAAMGETAVTVVVTNVGGRDCAVEGVPTVSLLQGRSPVELAIDHESINSPGQVDRARRALVRTGGQVRVILLWDGYRSQADDHTPQALTLHAPGVGSLPVELDQGPAPFDLMDGGQVSVSGWR